MVVPCLVSWENACPAVFINSDNFEKIGQKIAIIAAKNGVFHIFSDPIELFLKKNHVKYVTISLSIFNIIVMSGWVCMNAIAIPQNKR